MIWKSKHNAYFIAVMKGGKVLKSGIAHSPVRGFGYQITDSMGFAPFFFHTNFTLTCYELVKSFVIPTTRKVASAYHNDAGRMAFSSSTGRLFIITDIKGEHANVINLLDPTGAYVTGEEAIIHSRAVEFVPVGFNFELNNIYYDQTCEEINEAKSKGEGKFFSL